MGLHYLSRVLLLLSCTAFTLAYKRPATKRENSPFSDDLLTSETKNEGFFEDINFKSFFEDVGLKSSDSAPKAVRHQEPSLRNNRFQLHGQQQSNDYGFLPAEPLFKPSESRNRYTVVSSDDDFFAQESRPYDNFYGFDSSPFAASQHHRDYISPYSESRQTENFEDYGLPKGFFDHDFAADFSGDKKNNNNEKATQESKNEPKYGSSEPSQKEKDKTKKCETIHKDKMTCEICKDDFGGFSEHCSHSLHSGKDQKYANSRRNSNEDTYNPGNNQGGNKDGASSINNRDYHRNNQGGNKDGASSINNRAYHSPVNEAYSGNQQSEPTQKKENKNNFYNPFPEQSEVSPYNFDYLKEIDELISIGLKDISDQQNKQLHKKPTKHSKDKEDTKDTEKQASNKEPQQNEGEPAKHKIPQSHPNLKQYQQPQYKVLNPVENFKVLGKMVKQFSGKDRSNCKKRVTKKGMTCYVCPNKHGQVDEECMYENKDPSQGVHMMYKEEFSY